MIMIKRGSLSLIPAQYKGGLHSVNGPSQFGIISGRDGRNLFEIGVSKMQGGWFESRGWLMILHQLFILFTMYFLQSNVINNLPLCKKKFILKDWLLFFSKQRLEVGEILTPLVQGEWKILQSRGLFYWLLGIWREVILAIRTFSNAKSNIL